MSCIVCPHFGGYGHCGSCELPDKLPPHDKRLSEAERAKIIQSRAQFQEKMQALSALWSYDWCSREGWQQRAPEEGPIDSETYAAATAYRKNL